MSETAYNPTDVEKRCDALWEETRSFRARPGSKRPRYTIVIPPPNVTGQLHMGHALNTTIQDILIRFHRMKGFDSVWFPGKDHAGIATQNVIERELAKEGKTRHDLGRKGFVDRCWEWVEHYGGRIGVQLRALGASCDWSRERFTLDKGLSAAVTETFVRLYQKDLIYRGLRIINWCPRCHTALSDEEAPMIETEGKLTWIRYPLKDGDRFVTVATTRPETMLGDTAVAVHPDDERYHDIVGETVILPLLKREIPVVADEYVQAEFGSGAVKVTPAHDPNDFDIGQRHDLPRVKVMDDAAVMTAEAGPYAGLDRFEARARVVEDLKRGGFWLRQEDYLHNVPHCQRCRTVVEPALSEQWFVKMEPLGKPAVAAVKDGRVKFVPERYARTYFDWLEKFRDWCISRQLWWGHRIPAYHCKCGEIVVAARRPKACPKCGAGRLKQDEDVLDTWFSSALWPFSVMGWPKETRDLATYYPTDVLSTARDIIYFWVARMIIQGLELRGEVPFHTVLVHGTILDEHGVIMSKSRGNGIDPIEMIDKYGADAVRFSLVQLTSEGQDIRLAESRFDSGKKFANKIWNAARFVLDQLGEGAPKPPRRRGPAEDRWILSRLHSVTGKVTEAVEAYRFHDAAHELYHFFWGEFCAWYLEIVKPRLRDGDDADREAVRSVLAHVLDSSLRLFHPFIPFITEEIWQKLRPGLGSRGRAKTLALAAYPEVDEKRIDPALEASMERIFGIVTGVRDVRASIGLGRSEPVRVSASVSDAATRKVLLAGEDLLRRMAILEDLQVDVGLQKPEAAISKMVDGIQVSVHTTGFEAKVEAWKQRLEKEREKLEGQLRSAEIKLANPKFLENAPPQVVDRLRAHRDQLARSLEGVGQDL